MATKNFRSTVLEPTSEFAHGDKLRFTALATVGEVLKGSFSETTIGEDGVYSVDLQYGKHRIDYKPYEGVWRHFADVEVNADTLATTLQDLALASVPVTDETILVLQGILADAEVVKTESATIRDEAAASAAAAAASATQVDTALRKTHLFYVSKTGSDTTGDGSIATPFATIAHAVSIIKDYDSVNIILQGSTDADRHSIDETIPLSSRYVILTSQAYAGEHIDLADSITNVFSAGTFGGLMIARTAGREIHFYARTDKTLLKSSGQSNLAVLSTHIHIADSATFYLFSESIRSQGSVVATYNTKAEKIDSALPAVGSLVAVNTSVYATDSCLVFLKHTLFSGGENYLDCQTPSAISELSNGLKVINI